MIQLTYISSTVPGVTDEDVARILEVSRRRNAAAGLTGLLLYNGRRFLQTVEGDQRSIDAAFARIKRDPRHRGIALLSSHVVETRAFGSWGMAARRVSTQYESDNLVELVHALTEEVREPTIRIHFRSFAAIQPTLARSA